MIQQLMTFQGDREQLLERLQSFFTKTDEEARVYFIYHTQSPVVFLWNRRKLPKQVIESIGVLHTEIVTLKQDLRKRPLLTVVKGGKKD